MSLEKVFLLLCLSFSRLALGSDYQKLINTGLGKYEMIEKIDQYLLGLSASLKRMDQRLSAIEKKQKEQGEQDKILSRIKALEDFQNGLNVEDFENHLRTARAINLRNIVLNQNAISTLKNVEIGTLKDEIKKLELSISGIKDLLKAPPK